LRVTGPRMLCRKAFKDAEFHREYKKFTSEVIELLKVSEERPCPAR